jgi:RimJ/RimL family protein N-acetyltransferase
MSTLDDLWPLFSLQLRTPRLVLRPARDEDLPGLADAALAGIHDLATMPFVVPWTDAEPADMIRSIAQFHWRQRADLTPDAWSVEFAVLHDGVVIGTQGLNARRFPARKVVGTGSWLSQPHQGHGFGTEMRAAVLTFAFDWLGARVALSEAAIWNEASLRVSRSLGYRDNGTDLVETRPGDVREHQRLRLDAADFVRPDWHLEVTGADQAIPQLTGIK